MVTFKFWFRLWSYVRKTATCWVWTGTLAGPSPWRYGQIRFNGKMMKASRVIYAIIYGPIPPGLHVLHTCDNTACVRPDHLFTGTQKTNMQDAKRKGRDAWSKITHCVNGHDLSGTNVYYGVRGIYTIRGCRACHRNTQRRYTSRLETKAEGF